MENYMLHLDPAPNIPPPDDREQVLSVSMHPLDPLVALATGAAIIKIYNIKSFTFEEPLPQIGKVMSVHFSPCGHYLAAASSSNDQGTFLINLFGIDSRAGAYNFTLETDDSYLADTDDCKGNMKLHQDEITTVKFRPSKVVGAPCSSLVSGSADQTLRFWYFENFDMTMLRVISREHSGPIKDISFSDQGRFMCSVAEDKDYPCGVMIVWKFNFKKEVEADQLMRVPFVTQRVNRVQFFSAHVLVPNPFGDNLREYFLAVGTSKGVQIYALTQTKSPADRVLEWQTMLVHGAESVRQLDPFEELDDDHEDSDGENARQKNYTGIVLDHERSFRELKSHVEMLYNDPDDDAADRTFQHTNMLKLSIVDFIPCREEVTAIAMSEHLVIPEDPWRKVYGCNAIAYGTITGNVFIATLSATRKRDQEYHQFKPHSVCKLERHNERVTGIGLPSVQLNIALQRERYLGGNQHFIVSASLDETTRIIKWNCEPAKDWEEEAGARDIPHQFVPRGRDDKDSAVTLERPVTKNRALQMSSLAEIVRKTNTEAKDISTAEEKRKENIEKFGYLSGEMTMKDVQQTAAELKKKGVLEEKKQSAFATLSKFEMAAQVAAGKMPSTQQTIPEEEDQYADDDELDIPEVPVQPTSDEIIRKATEYTPKPPGVTTKYFMPVPGQRYKPAKLVSGLSKLQDFQTLAIKKKEHAPSSRICGGPVVKNKGGKGGTAAEPETCHVM